MTQTILQDKEAIDLAVNNIIAEEAWQHRFHPLPKTAVDDMRAAFVASLNELYGQKIESRRTEWFDRMYDLIQDEELYVQNYVREARMLLNGEIKKEEISQEFLEEFYAQI